MGGGLGHSYLGRVLVFVWGGALRRGLISVFRGLFTSIGEIVIFGGDWALGNDCMKF